MSDESRFAEATELRPRRVGEILDAAIQICARHWRPLFALSATILLPFQFLAALAAVSVDPSLTETIQEWQKQFPTDASARPKFTGAQFAAVGVSGALSIISTFILTAALTKVLSDVFLRQGPNRREAVRVALRRGPVMLLSVLLLGIAVTLFIGVTAGGSLLLAWLVGDGGGVLIGVLGVGAAVIFGMYLYVRLSVGGPAIVAEGAGPIQALRRSFALAKGRFWAIVGTLLLSTLIAGIPAAIISGIVTSTLGAAGGHNKGFEFVWQAIGGTVGAAITAPFASAVAVILYFDLRVRREGFDLEQLSGGTDLGLAPPPPSGPPTSLL